MQLDIQTGFDLPASSPTRSGTIWSPALPVILYQALFVLDEDSHPSEWLLDAMILRALYDAQKDGLLR